MPDGLLDFSERAHAGKMAARTAFSSPQFRTAAGTRDRAGKRGFKTDCAVPKALR
jgi:hypothetical protein